MKAKVRRTGAILLVGLVALIVGLGGCQSAPTRPVANACVPPQGHHLETAFQAVERDLSTGCATHFNAYVERLLTVAEGDPQPRNKRRFSEFFVWASEQGLLSKLQAQQQYNRHFNVKFVSLMGDFNNCTQACPRKAQLMAEMEQELADKERGLLKISADQPSYYRADRLFKEAELVLEATCSACLAAR